MVVLSDEKHPSIGPMPPDQLRALVARATKEQIKRRSQSERDEQKEKVRAQLFWFDVAHTGYGTLPTLEKALRQAVEAHKCDSQAPRILEHQRRASEVARKKAEAWQKSTTPSERASADIDRFMDHYFLNNGKSDRSKTAEALVIDWYPNQKEMLDRLNRHQDLHVCLAGPHGTPFKICVGWDRHAVSALSKDISGTSEKSKAKKREAEWEEAMQDHREFVSSLKKHKVKKAALTEKEKLKKCVGSYVVSCEELSGDTESLSINIAVGPKPNILEAAIDFGVIEGTMLLCFNEDALDAHIGEQGDHDDSEDDHNESEDEYMCASHLSKKRKAPAKVAASKRSTKQAKTSTQSLRLFYRLRGRETGEGVVFYSPEKGHLDFTDSFATFNGVGRVDFVGKVSFKGFKTGSEPAAVAEPWSAFSEKVYERERVSRWH